MSDNSNSTENETIADQAVYAEAVGTATKLARQWQTAYRKAGALTKEIAACIITARSVILVNGVPDIAGNSSRSKALTAAIVDNAIPLPHDGENLTPEQEADNVQATSDRTTLKTAVRKAVERLRREQYDDETLAAHGLKTTAQVHAENEQAKAKAAKQREVSRKQQAAVAAVEDEDGSKDDAVVVLDVIGYCVPFAENAQQSVARLAAVTDRLTAYLTRKGDSSLNQQERKQAEKIVALLTATIEQAEDVQATFATLTADITEAVAA